MLHYVGDVLLTLATPLDHYVAGFVVWAQSAWFVWVALAACVAAVIAGVVVSRWRTRAHARVPHYRRRR